MALKTGYAPLDTVLALLQWVPGAVNEHVNVSQAVSVVAGAELAILTTHPDFPAMVRAAAKALVANADTVFLDAVFRTNAVILLNTAYPQ